MFDRLGRKEDETPFVVEWFVEQGVEVWSAMEGQQRFDTHVDKLMNYIRYWQASGESVKTSIRVKTRLEQLTECGYYTGGSVPYGYRLIKQGRMNKRNKEVNDIVIDEDAAQIVRLIFYKYVNEGCGAQRISRYMMEMHITRADGSDFPNTSIISILKRRLYTGVLTNGDAQSAFIPELQIIDQETFDRAQELMKARTQHRNDVPLNLAGRSLLVGNVYCGHCRNRLTLTTSGRQRVNKDGIVHSEVRARYNCHYRVRHPNKCDGQSGCGVAKLDGIIDEVIRYQLDKIKMSCGSEVIAEQNQNMESATQEQREFEKLQSWADLYDNCTFAAKKMIVSQFIKAVYVYRDYRIEVEFNVSFEDFQALSANCRNDGNEKTTVYLAETEKSRPA